MLPPKSLYLPPPLVDFEHKDPNEANPVFFLYYLQYSHFVFTRVPSSNLYSVINFGRWAWYSEYLPICLTSIFPSSASCLALLLPLEPTHLPSNHTFSKS